MDSEKHMSIELLKKIDCADVSQISYRDLYFRFWTCRDFEISHVWNRAIFLTAFLIACFAGYGTILLAMLGKGVSNLEIVNGVAFCVTVIGVVVSVLWIMMAKGSKMWYERWENVIEAFKESEKYKKAFGDDGEASIAGMNYNKIDGFKEPDLSDCIFNTNGGRYSVSRINVFIGQLAFVIWSALMIGHLALAITWKFNFQCMKNFFESWLPISFVVIGIGALLLFYFNVVPCLKPGNRGSVCLFSRKKNKRESCKECRERHGQAK